MSAKSLKACVNTAKARWLSRVMMSLNLSSSAKVFAYFIFDKLNCVTLDSWPSQETLVRLLGRRSTKTIHRLAKELFRRQLIDVIPGKRRSSNRYAPRFDPAESDIIDPRDGHSGVESADKNVLPSSISIPITSVSTAAVASSGPIPSYERGKRGAIEIKLAQMLGLDGFDILSRLSTIDDRHVDRLCRAFAEGRIGTVELAAARLAVKFVK
jgi:hypothetical protein